jgi:hypothetical protein
MATGTSKTGRQPLGDGHRPLVELSGYLIPDAAEAPRCVIDGVCLVARTLALRQPIHRETGRDDARDDQRSLARRLAPSRARNAQNAGGLGCDLGVAVTVTMLDEYTGGPVVSVVDLGRQTSAPRIRWVMPLDGNFRGATPRGPAGPTVAVGHGVERSADVAVAERHAVQCTDQPDASGMGARAGLPPGRRSWWRSGSRQKGQRHGEINRRIAPGSLPWRTAAKIRAHVSPFTKRLREEHVAKVPIEIRWVGWLKHVPRRLHRPIGAVVVVVLLGAALAFAALLVAAISQTLQASCWRLLRWASVSPERKTLGVMLLFVAGLAFYRLRRWSRQLYAWIEGVTALTLMWLGIEAAATSKDKALSLVMGGIYLLVRAFDNSLQGRKEALERQQRRMAAARPEILQMAAELAQVETEDKTDLR